MTPAQIAILKAYIQADPVLGPKTSGSGTDFGFIADAMNVAASPNFWVWRTTVSEDEIVGMASADGTNWSWPALIARSQGERDVWGRMLSGGPINPSRANVRQGVADIFSGSANSAPAQRAHLLAISRRLATLAEKLLATGVGSTASPANMGWEGLLTIADIGQMFLPQP